MQKWNFAIYDGEKVAPNLIRNSPTVQLNDFVNDSDGLNIIGIDNFEEVEWIEFDPEPLAICHTKLNKCGESDFAPVITDADISFNPKFYFQIMQSIIIDECVDIYDFETVLIHELGHSFGLGHIENISLNYTVMNPSTRKNSINSDLWGEDLCFAYVLHNHNIPCEDFGDPEIDKAEEPCVCNLPTCKSGYAAAYSSKIISAILYFERKYLNNKIPKIKKTILYNIDALENTIYNTSPQSKALATKLDSLLYSYLDNVTEAFTTIHKGGLLNENDIAILYDFLYSLQQQTNNTEIIAACEYIINYLPYLKGKPLKEALIILDKGEIPNNIGFKDPITIVGLLNNHVRSTTLYLDYFLNTQGEFSYQIIDLNGKIVNSFTEYQYAAKHSQPISINNLPSGIYFIQVSHNNNPVNAKNNNLRFMVSK